MRSCQMNKFLKPFLIFLVCYTCLATTVLAGENALLLDSSITLKTFSVEVKQKWILPAGQKVEQLDTAELHAPLATTLADVLSNNNSIFIKSYGFGSLATGSIRGCTAAQTSTLWNGFNLQSPMNGLLDYALVPALFLDDASLSFGGASALFGSGSVGATLLLRNLPTFNKGVQATVSGSVGSFNAYQQAAKLSWSNAKISLSAKAFNHSAQNNFPFYNTAEPGKPKQYQQNAALQQSGVLIENYFQLNSKQLLSLRFWYQSNDREIPVPIISAPSTQNQQDEFYRGNVEWTYRLKRNLTLVKAAYFDERLNFNDPQISLFAYSRSRNLLAQAENTYFINSELSVQAGISTNQYNALSEGYGKDYLYQNKNAAFAGIRYNSKDQSWKNSVVFRKEFLDGNALPFTCNLGIEKLFFKQLKVRASISKNYRIPNLNDLFWKEQYFVGNANLLPESGWNEEVGIGESWSKNKFQTEGEIALFNGLVNNLIVWQQGANGVWSPQNISAVWSRGIEVNWKMKLQFNSLKVELNAKYNHTLSSENRHNSSNSDTYGKQVLYVPFDSYQAAIKFYYKGVLLSYRHNYVGKRFTNSSNTEYLRPYQLGDVQVSKTFILKKISLTSYLQVNNCWNEAYQVIAWRPMPMTNYTIGIAITYTEK